MTKRLHARFCAINGQANEGGCYVYLQLDMLININKTCFLSNLNLIIFYLAIKKNSDKKLVEDS